MSKEDLDNSVYKFERPAKIGYRAGPIQYVSEQIPAEQKGDSVCYDLSGNITDNENKCAAKSVKSTLKTRYFIKWCLDGPDKGHPLNPYSIYFKEGDENRMDPKRGGKRYEFKSVNEHAFSFYLRFLKSRLVSYCQAAEREILNG